MPSAPRAPAGRGSEPAGGAGGRAALSFDAVIFDLDGTLADTLEDLAGALNRTLRDEGLPAYDYPAVRGMIGNGIRRLITDALPQERRTDQTIARCLDRFMADYGEHCLVDTRLYDGVAALVAALRTDAVALAVLSNKADELTLRIVDALIGSAAFKAVRGARPGIPLKPDPSAALLVAESLGVAPAEIVYVGDSPTDMLTAAAAGMVPVGVSWGFKTRSELAGSGARVVLDHPLDLAALRRRA
jgi:phosphoglycolate phosphatase